jgi:hypothetical protein
MAALTISSCWCAQERGSRIRFRRLASLTCSNYRNEWIAPAARLSLRFGTSVEREVRMRQEKCFKRFGSLAWRASSQRSSMRRTSPGHQRRG